MALSEVILESLLISLVSTLNLALLLNCSMLPGKEKSQVLFTTFMIVLVSSLFVEGVANLVLPSHKIKNKTGLYLVEAVMTAVIAVVTIRYIMPAPKTDEEETRRDNSLTCLFTTIFMAGLVVEFVYHYSRLAHNRVPSLDE